MKTIRLLPVALFALLATSAPLAAQTPAPITISVDASEAPRGIIHVTETIPAAPGPLTLEYPRWIPGEHAPNGPIPNLATLVVRAGDTRLPWQRDLVDLYAFTVTVPSGATSVVVTFDYLGADLAKYSAARLSTPNILALTWNKVTITPRVADYRDITVIPSVTLPDERWQYGSALEQTAKNGNTYTFAPVTYEMLIDSPLDAGTNVKRFALGDFDGAPVALNIFADNAEQLDVKDETIAKFRNLVAEMRALYGARHFKHYDFLLTVSDVLPGEGLEHHQSSDDGVDGDFLTDPGSFTADADLLPHEFNHSWNGKYRRPFDLAAPTLHDPQKDDLLWVYEGMTEHYGMLQAERSGLLSKEEWLDRLAGIYAELDTTTGRLTTTLGDTAIDSPNLYSAPNAFSSMRRSVDYYDESALMWLEADTRIRALTGGKKSLDDVARAFYGLGGDTGAKVVTYDRAAVVAALNAVAPDDWNGFFKQRVETIAPHPPDPFTPGGWKLVYTATPSAYEKTINGARKRLDLRYSLGIVASPNGTIGDVIDGSAAAKAGLRPGDKIAGVNGRTLDAGAQTQLDAALVSAENGSGVRLLITGGNRYREITLDVRTGPRYPRLERIAGTPDVLSLIAAPKRRSITAPPRSARSSAA